MSKNKEIKSNSITSKEKVIKNKNDKNDNFLSKKLLEETDIKLRESYSFLKKELFNLRFQKTLGELTNTSRFSQVRKDIARINTEISRRKNIGVK